MEPSVPWFYIIIYAEAFAPLFTLVYMRNNVFIGLHCYVHGTISRNICSLAYTGMYVEPSVPDLQWYVC